MALGGIAAKLALLFRKSRISLRQKKQRDREPSVDGHDAVQEAEFS